MRKFTVSMIAALTAAIMLSSTAAYSRKWESFAFFPMFTTSPAVVFEQSEESCDRVEVVEQSEKPQVKFKIIEWLRSLF